MGLIPSLRPSKLTPWAHALEYVELIVHCRITIAPSWTILSSGNVS